MRIIASWIYLENSTEKGAYPQVPGNSNSDRFQDIYRRCLVTFFTTARIKNPKSKLILFTNDADRLISTNIGKNIYPLLMQIDVEIKEIAYVHQPPKSQTLWRNQFFMLDILSALKSLVNSHDSVMLLDSDMIWNRQLSIEKLWEQVEEIGYATMCPIADNSEIINGYRLDELESLAKTLQINLKSKLAYSGGEFVALRGDMLDKVASRTNKIWQLYISFMVKNSIKYIEEAHLLSMTYSSLGFQCGGADTYVRRIWTQIFHYQNRLSSDSALAILHLPAEKRFGIRRLANQQIRDFQSKEDRIGIDAENLLKLGIPKNKFNKFYKDLPYSILLKIFRYLKK